MNFALFRRKYKGKVNKLAYFGMLSDVTVIALLYFYNKNRKERKLSNLQQLKENEKQSTLALYPSKIDEIEFTYFSPYTPVPYHNSNVTMYQHHHIDLVGYLNDNQLNINNFYYRNYHDVYDHKGENNYLLDWKDVTQVLPNVSHSASKHH